ncbi:MAG: sigma-70 family RNA polymerase sigma factor [Planctomycetia bacterium]|nr:sigma-70 family RNA polymerase sigma factor [Planctomycetia bacterium]
MTQAASTPATQAPPLEATDEQLLLRYRDAGDVEAFETLVHRYEKPIYNYLLHYLHSPSLAEDAFQSTFLRVHEASRAYSGDRPVRPWLYSIATHLAIDALRKEGRRQAVSLDEQQTTDEADLGSLLNVLKSTVQTPLEQLETDERAKWTRQAVDDLPDRLRAVLLLIYFQGLKYQEVAEALHLPVGTVKSRVHKALLALNTAWRRNHPEGR